jgi:hypothetical protein
MKPAELLEEYTVYSALYYRPCAHCSSKLYSRYVYCNCCCDCTKQEVDLERRKETCAQALSLVATAEELHYQLRADQDALETARAAGHEVCSFCTRLYNGQRINHLL